MKMVRVLPAAILIPLALAALAPRPAFAASGGPDAGQYTWIDSNEPNYGPLQVSFASSSSFTTIADETVESVTLPWAFPFYGGTSTTAWVSSNGWLSFTNPGGAAVPTSAPIPTASLPNNMVAFEWADLIMTTSSCSYGPGTDGSFLMFFTGTFKNGGATFTLKVMLYQSGVIKLYYADPGDTTQTTIGIENGTGAIGTQVWRNGTGTNGTALASDFGYTFFPPPKLNCSSPPPTPINCGQKLTAQSNVGGPSNVSVYGCATGTYLGPEKTFTFTLSRATNITIALSNAGTKALRANLIGAGCNELKDCMDGGKTTITKSFVPAGTYTIVVDGVTAADAGPFDLQLTCANSAVTAACDGPPVSGTINAGQPSTLTNWTGCNNIPASGGPGGEVIYEVTMPASGGNLLADLVSGPTNLHVYIVDSNGFDPAFPTCLVSGDRHAGAYNLPGNKTYYVVVDDSDPATPGGSFQLKISCAVRLSCGTPQVIDVTNPAPISGTTIGQPNNVDNYWCSAASIDGPGELTGYTGGEAVYKFTVPPGEVVGFYFNSPNANLKPFILTSCNEGQCVNQVNCLDGASAGDYLLVIDGLNGASDNFTIAPFTVPAAVGFKRWSDCRECIDTSSVPACAAELTQTSNTVWHFGDRNYCGWGCQFALYVVAECGTELHLPMWDVETGDIKIYDVLRNRYVDLTATGPMPPDCTSGLWPQSGTEIKWKDSGCTSSPCTVPPTDCSQCGGGADWCVNNDANTGHVTPIDVNFKGNPSACGVYRMEFPNQGGCVWDLYANCDGTIKEGFPIYADICSAMSDFHPYPDLVLNNVRVDNSDCAALNANVIVDVLNQGCLAASNVPVSISDGTTTKTYSMGDILAGKVVSKTFTFGPVASTPATLTVIVDPGTPGSVLECSEVTGSKSCGKTTGQRQLTAQACPNTCSTLAEAGPSDMTVCEGKPINVDGKGSSSNCLTVGPIQYQWKFDGTVVPGCDFTTVPNLSTCTIPGTLITSGLPHIVTLTTRCAGAPTQCTSTDQIIVTANADVPPPSVGNTLRGIRNVTARNDISWSWSSVVDPGLSGYKMWRHVAKVDLPTRANRTLVGAPTSPATTTLNEPNGVPNPPALALYQVVGLSCSGLNESPY